MHLFHSIYGFYGQLHVFQCSKRIAISLPKLDALSNGVEIITNLLKKYVLFFKFKDKTRNFLSKIKILA